MSLGWLESLIRAGKEQYKNLKRKSLKIFDAFSNGSRFSRFN